MWELLSCSPSQGHCWHCQVQLTLSLISSIKCASVKRKACTSHGSSSLQLVITSSQGVFRSPASHLVLYSFLFHSLNFEKQMYDIVKLHHKSLHYEFLDLLVRTVGSRLPWWLRWWRVCLRYKRPRFNPWVGKIPQEGNGNPLQYSCLENSTDRGAWWAIVHGVA